MLLKNWVEGAVPLTGSDCLQVPKEPVDVRVGRQRTLGRISLERNLLPYRQEVPTSRREMVSPNFRSGVGRSEAVGEFER